jgi:outer membrane lipoprotein SlyB
MILNSGTTRNAAFGILIATSLISFSGCSPKPSSEEIAAQVKIALEAEKAKEQAAATAKPAAPAAAPAAVAPVPKPTVKHAQPAQTEQAAPVHKSVCGNCGVVVSVKETEQEGEGSGLGVIAGGAAGGLLGNQIGKGTGRDLATIAGVVGGAVAGNKIEKTMKKTKVYNVTVKMDSGGEQVLHLDTAPGVVAGDKIKIEDNHIIKR